MIRKRRINARFFLVGSLVFLLVGVGVFFGIQFFTKTGIFRVPGIVYYDDSLEENELSVLKTIFTDEIDLDKDVFISARNSLTKPELAEGEFIYNISVPVTDFYNTETNVNAENPDILFADKYLADVSFDMIDLDELDFKRKLLSINDKYYLDDFDAGAVFRIIKFESDQYDEEIKPLVEKTFSKEFPAKSNVLTFAQTGVTALSRGMNEKLYAVGDATYFAENIKDYLSTIAVNLFTLQQIQLQIVSERSCGQSRDHCNVIQIICHFAIPLFITVCGQASTTT